MWNAGDSLTLVIKNLCLQQKAAPGERSPGLPTGKRPYLPGMVSTLSQPEDAAAGREEQAREGLQHHEAAEVLEGVIRDVPDLVESQGHGLQRWQVVQSLDRDLRQSIIVQPQVTQGEQPLKALLGHHRDKVCIQASEWERNRVGISERWISHCFMCPQCYAKGVLMPGRDGLMAKEIGLGCKQ